MFLCVDTYYHESGSRVAGIVFPDIHEAVHQKEYLLETGRAEKYEPGRLYRRELPGILTLLDVVEERIGTIFIDGYVWLSADSTLPGLGAYLFNELKGEIPVIGVAKSPWRKGSVGIRIFRGRSKKPLYITSAGFDVQNAANLVQQMHGDYRIPTLFRQVDMLARH